MPQEESRHVEAQRLLPVEGLIAIDPALLVLSQASGAGMAAEVAEQEGGGGEDEGEEDEDSESGGRAKDTAQHKSKRLTARERAMKYGMVDGVMRGNTVHRIIRQNEKRRPITDASSATTQYNRELPLIISHAERMALETDAYVLILAQQATGSSTSIHFASEHMRRDAFEPCANLVNQFQSLMMQLVIAERSTALALAQNLEASEKARAEAEEKLMERESAVNLTEVALAASQSANRSLLEELETLRNSVSCSPQRPPG